MREMCIARPPTTHRNRELPEIFLALASTTVFPVMDGPKNVMQLRLRPAQDENNHGRSKGKENIGGVPDYGGWSGAERCTFLAYTYARVRGVAL